MQAKLAKQLQLTLTLFLLDFLWNLLVFGKCLPASFSFLPSSRCMVGKTILIFFVLLYLNVADLLDKKDFLCTHLQITHLYKKVQHCQMLLCWMKYYLFFFKCYKAMSDDISWMVWVDIHIERCVVWFLIRYHPVHRPNVTLKKLTIFKFFVMVMLKLNFFRKDLMISCCIFPTLFHSSYANRLNHHPGRDLRFGLHILSQGQIIYTNRQACKSQDYHNLSFITSNKDSLIVFCQDWFLETHKGFLACKTISNQWHLIYFSIGWNITFPWRFC